jgi:uncharacterized RDD family membrane protein YckC
MSQDGSPPDTPPDPGQDAGHDAGHEAGHEAGHDASSDPGTTGSPGSDVSGQPGYNPYPDNWNTTPPPPTSPYAQQNPYAAQYPSDPSDPGPTPNPYGQPDPYGQAPYGQQSPYGQASPYGQQPYGQPGQPAAASPGAPANPYSSASPDRPTFGFGGYAGWFTRVGAYLIDQICAGIAGLPLWIGYIMILSNTTTTTDAQGVQHVHTSSSPGAVFLILVGAVTSLVFFVWNICIRQGRTGASIGKSVLAIRLVNADLQPIGAGWSFLRYVLHIVDGIPCYLGYLWPIWDSRKQTFADKIMSTFVIQATAPAPTSYPPAPAPYQTY